MPTIDVKDFGNTKVIKIRGEFFLQFVRTVEESWNKAVADGAEVVGIDCKDLKFLDSSAIGTLVKILNYANTHKITLVFFDLNDSITRIFNKAKLNKIFTILSREEFETQYLQ
ncbi:MAG: hypothetical protein A2W19_15350 [Spirochaetes bacterium RBG_16_49_21]|nr:MAG: hypothetical protein A2W19_15350 [Spirochaetes bacterium RBG_16_49_21]